MKANELRIGNLIMFGGMQHKCTCYDILNIYESVLINKVPSGSYRPIPLTKKWLLKFGFYYHGCFNYSKDIFNIGYITKDEIFQIKYKFSDSDWFIKDIQYVHQLQNLFFFLTGEELNLIDNEQ